MIACVFGVRRLAAAFGGRSLGASLKQKRRQAAALQGLALKPILHPREVVPAVHSEGECLPTISESELWERRRADGIPMIGISIEDVQSADRQRDRKAHV